MLQPAKRLQPKRSRVGNHSLSIAAFLLFLACMIGQYLTGFEVYNQEQVQNGGAEVGIVAYVATGHFVEATFENWESEFLQMGMFVLLTAFLIQKGSAESRKPESEGGEEEEEEANDRERRGGDENHDVPWPVRRGGWVLKVYENSLSLAFFLLFLLSFVFHAWGGAAAYNEEEALRGGTSLTPLAFVVTSRFWFQSFQNWQSEFLSVLAMVVLSIFLRQKGSPESKPVEKPHRVTGAD